MRTTVAWRAVTAPLLRAMTALPLASFLPVSSSKPEMAESPTFDEAVAGSAQRVKFQATWSAVNSSPVCHITPLRMLNVQVFRSGDAVQLSASIGRVILSGPVIARYSIVWRH